MMPTKIRRNRRLLLASGKNSARMMQHFLQTAQSSSWESFEMIQHGYVRGRKPSSCTAYAAWILRVPACWGSKTIIMTTIVYPHPGYQKFAASVFHKFALSRSYAIRLFHSFLSWWVYDIKFRHSRSVKSEWNPDFWRKTAYFRVNDFISSLIFFCKPPAEPVPTPHT